MGEVAHKPRKFHGKDDFSIPITWLVSPKSALIEKQLLTEFHEKYGDVVGYMLNYEEHAMNRHGDLMKPENKDKLKAHVSAEVGAVKEILPWADVQIIGTGYRSNSLVQVMEDLGIPGIWGSCPFQIGTDGITDFGAPWGQWYVNPANYKKPKKFLGKVVNLEWTCRDLNKSFHYAQPEAYSTDPNDVESESKCTDTNVEYWKKLLGQYMRNLDINELVFFHQHQEAHEMEATPTCVPFMESGQARIDYTAKMLGLFLDHLVTRDNVEIVDANEALRIFNARYKGNQPDAFMNFEDIPIYDLCPEYKKAVEGKPFTPKHVYLSLNEGFYNYVNNFVTQSDWRLKTPPWKDCFLYYDAECMLIFDKPQQNPVWICNYLDEERSWNDELMLSEESIPLPNVEEKIADSKDDIFDVSLSIKADKRMPYGVALWGSNFELCSVEVTRSISAVHTKIVNDSLLFARFNLLKGNNEISLRISHSLKNSSK